MIVDIISICGVIVIVAITVLIVAMVVDTFRDFF